MLFLLSVLFVAAYSEANPAYRKAMSNFLYISPDRGHHRTLTRVKTDAAALGDGMCEKDHTTAGIPAKLRFCDRHDEMRKVMVLASDKAKACVEMLAALCREHDVGLYSKARRARRDAYTEENMEFSRKHGDRTRHFNKLVRQGTFFETSRAIINRAALRALKMCKFADQDWRELQKRKAWCAKKMNYVRLAMPQDEQLMDDAMMICEMRVEVLCAHYRLQMDYGQCKRESPNRNCEQFRTVYDRVA
jgi:hypothetical protein